MKYLLITFLFLNGCASTQWYNYECYKVMGPQEVHGPANKPDTEQVVRKVDAQVDLFGDKPKGYICVDVTPNPEPREYPKGK